MTLLRVEGVALHVVMTDEVNVINLGDLKLVFLPFEQINIVIDCHVSLLKGKVLVWKNSDDCILQVGFLLVIKYKIRCPDRRILSLR